MKYHITIYFLLFFGHSVCGQICDSSKLDESGRRMMRWVCENLIGQWTLKTNVRFCEDDRDTVVQKASETSSEISRFERPKVTLTFQKNGTIIISEFPYQKTIIETTAKWIIKSRDDLIFKWFYIEIFESDNPAISLEFIRFIGNLTLTGNELELTNKVSDTNEKCVDELNFIRIN